MVKKNPKKKIHYAMYIFVCCCVVNFCFFSLSASLVSVFIGYASAGVHAGPGDWAFNSTIGAFVGVAFAPLMGRWLQGNHFRGVCLLSLFLMAGKFYGLALATELWQVYILGALSGIAKPVLMSMVIPTLMGNWFAEDKRGKYMGIVAACAGLGTAIWAPVFVFIINVVGYRIGYIIDASLIVICVLPCIFVFRFKPEEKGLQPYGYDPDKPRSTNNITLESGTSAKRALRTPAFWCICFAMCILALGISFNSYQIGIATEVLSPAGFDVKTCAIIGATMVSTAATANIISTLAFGFFLDKWGIKIATKVFSAFFICAFVVYLLSNGSIIMLYVAAFLLGTHNALASVGMPLSLRLLLGNRDYAKIYAYVCMGISFVASFGNSIIGWIYQTTGTYLSACWFGLGVSVLFTVLATLSISRIGKVTWDLQGGQLGNDQLKGA